eukprot:2905998-Rhodomonas_salina.1
MRGQDSDFSKVWVNKKTFSFNPTSQVTRPLSSRVAVRGVWGARNRAREHRACDRERCVNSVREVSEQRGEVSGRVCRRVSPVIRAAVWAAVLVHTVPRSRVRVFDSAAHAVLWVQ